MSKTTRDPAAKKQAILDVSVMEFSIKGYHGANTSEIAELAGCSVGTVFKIFGTKAELANAVFIECREKYHLYLPAISTEIDPKKQFHRFIVAMQKMYENHPHHFVFFESHLHEDFINAHSVKVRKSFRNDIKLWIEAMQKAGVFVDIPSELIRAAVIGPFVRMVREALDGNMKIKKKYFGLLEQMSWNAVAKNQ